MVEPADRSLAVFGIDLAQDGVELGLLAVIAFARLRGSDVKQKRKTADLPDQLQKLRLPVLQRIAQHLHGVLGSGHRHVVRCCSLT